MNSNIDQETLRRDSTFSGGARWIYTVAAIGAIVLSLGLAHRRPQYAVVIAISGVINGIAAAINWRNWLKKPETEKAPSRFLPQLQIKEVCIPLKREEFNRARNSFGLNLSISAIALLYTVCGILSLFSPHVPLALRLGFTCLGIVAVWILWHCGKRVMYGAKMLTCPGCKDLLTSQGNSVLKTGCCRKCGHSILID